MADGKTTLRRDAKSIKKIANEAVYQHVSSPADEKYVGQRKAIALRFRRKIQLGHPQEDLRKQAPTPHMRAFEVKHPDRRSGGARSHAYRSVPPRSTRSGISFRRFMQLLTASPHIRSNQYGPYPHSACSRQGSYED
jgi:hypothetical protein